MRARLPAPARRAWTTPAPRRTDRRGRRRTATATRQPRASGCSCASSAPPPASLAPGPTPRSPSARSRAARHGRTRRRAGDPHRSARHLRGQAAHRPRRRRRSVPPRLLGAPRRRGGARARVRGDRRAELPQPARRSRGRSSSSARSTGWTGAALGRDRVGQAAVDDVERLLEGFRAAPLASGRAGPPRRAARPLPPARADRVRPRRRGNAGHARIRDPGGDQLPQRRGGRAGGHLARAARARPGGDPRADDDRRGSRPRRSTRPARAGQRLPNPSARAPTAPWSSSTTSTPTPGRRPPPAPTSTSSQPRSTGSRPPRRSGSWGRAEQARLEAYGIFELGPEQRLRGIAPSLFRRIEGLFWYGDGGQAGLVQLVKRKDAGAELEESVAALQTELEQAAQRVGSSSSTAAMSRTAPSSSSARGSRPS